MASERVAIAGSHRNPSPEGNILGAADLTERILVTVVVRRKAELPPLGRSPRIISHEELVANHGATAMDSSIPILVRDGGST
jgi:kumamolisin